MTSTSTLDAQGQLTTLKTMKGNTVIRDMGFGFNAQTGNLTWRTGMLSQKETFGYDQLDRLKSVKEVVAEVETMAIGFEPNGNISSKTGLGNYGYHLTRKHAVESVDNPGGLVPSNGQSIRYNAFNSAEQLKDTVDADAFQLDIMYGPDQQRWKSVLKKNGTDVKTIIFAGDYEKFIDNGITKELYYIGAGDGLAAIYMKPQNGAASMYYAHTDHLGSIISLTDSAGTAAFQASYDAWGRQTVGLNTIGFYRGYTGHEHLPEFGLINMNGRMYDPAVGRFLSPDNYVQAADFSQSFNRYSYCWNNPLKYTDPSGELIGELITLAAFVYYGGVQSNFMNAANNGGNPFNPGDWDWKSPWTYVGMASSGFGAYNQIGGLNGFATETSSVPNLFNLPENPDFLASIEMKPGRLRLRGGELWADQIPDVQVYGIRGAMSNPVVQNMYKTHAAFWGHPLTQFALATLPIAPALSGFTKAYAGARPLTQFAGKAGTTIIGEGMARVEAAAASRLGSVILNDMPKFTGNIDQVTSQMMQYNRQWILNQMRSGRTILDIGLDVNRVNPSIFYPMEQNMIKNYQILHPGSLNIIRP